MSFSGNTKPRGAAGDRRTHNWELNQSLWMHASAPIESYNYVLGNPVARVDADAPRPAHTCTVGGAVAMGVLDEHGTPCLQCAHGVSGIELRSVGRRFAEKIQWEKFKIERHVYETVNKKGRVHLFGGICDQ